MAIHDLTVQEALNYAIGTGGSFTITDTTSYYGKFGGIYCISDTVIASYAKKKNVSNGFAFNSGGTTAIVAGMSIAGATSGMIAKVDKVVLTGGTWAGGDAAGYLVIQLFDDGTTSAFTTGENLNLVNPDTKEVVSSNVATVVAGNAGGTIVGDSLPAGTVIPFEMSQIALTSGECEIYLL